MEPLTADAIPTLAYTQPFEKTIEKIEAEPQCLKILELYQHLLGEEHPFAATNYYNLIELYRSEFYDLFEGGAIGSSKHEGDISFWIDIAKNYSDPILELGCGTGRISVPLAKIAFDVTGLDISEEMLSIAKTKSSQINWVQADARNFDLRKQFQLVLFPYNAMLELQPDEIKSCLNCVREHLKPSGRLVIDIVNFSPNLLLKLFLVKGEELASIFKESRSAGTVVVTKEKEYDAANQILTTKRLYRFTSIEKEVSTELKQRIYFPQEIDTLLRWSGFEIEQKFGDYDRSIFTSNSPQQLIICKPSSEFST